MGSEHISFNTSKIGERHIALSAAADTICTSYPAFVSPPSCFVGSSPVVPACRVASRCAEQQGLRGTQGFLLPSAGALNHGGHTSLTGTGRPLTPFPLNPSCSLWPQDLKCFVFSLIGLHFKIKPI